MSRLVPLKAAVLAGLALGPWAAPLAAQPEIAAPVAATAPARDANVRTTPVVEAVKRVKGAVVNVHSERTARGPGVEEFLALAPSQSRVNGMGTGIVIDHRGYIVTNHHVIEDVSVLRVRLADGKGLPARVVARDAENDLALLKVEAAGPLPVMPLGTASDLMIAETVVAVGNAYGYEHTVSVGVVSATGRNVTLNKEVSYKALIQTDAAINPGNSGGPLVNTLGELVGVNVAIRAGAQGIGFAIPAETMIRCAAGMIAAKVRGGLAHGLVLRDEVLPGHTERGVARRVVVERVEANSPAAKAGVRAGDAVVSCNGLAVAHSLDVERGLIDVAAGEKVALVVRRDGAERTLELTLDAPAARAPAGPAEAVWRRLGLRVQEANPDVVVRHHPQLHGGMVVTDVRPDSPAGRAGIRRADILIGLHQWEMLTQDNVLFVLNHQDLPAFSPLKFFIVRDGQVHRGTLQVAD